MEKTEEYTKDTIRSVRLVTSGRNASDMPEDQFGKNLKEDIKILKIELEKGDPLLKWRQCGI